MHPRQVEDLAGFDEVAKRAGEGVDEVKKRAVGGNNDPVERASSFLEGQGEKVRTGTTSPLEMSAVLMASHSCQMRSIVHLIQSYSNMR
jgi:hypothetical protein